MLAIDCAIGTDDTPVVWEAASACQRRPRRSGFEQDADKDQQRKHDCPDIDGSALPLGAKSGIIHAAGNLIHSHAYSTP